MAVKPQLQKKIDLVEDLKQSFQEAEVTILADYHGINVADITTLRAKLREVDVKFKVMKNTLTKRAAHDAGIDNLDEFLTGPTVVSFGKDPVALAKALNDFAKANDNLKIKAGLLNGKLIDAANIATLAELPSREELLSKLLGSMKAPLNNMVNVLQGPLRNFAYALEAYRKQQAGEA